MKFVVFSLDIVRSRNNVHIGSPTRPSSPPPVPQSPTLYFVPSSSKQYHPDPFHSVPLSTNSSSTPLASRQAVQQSVHNPGPECLTPAPTSSFLALELSDAIPLLSGTPRLETQPESATSPFFSSSHALRRHHLLKIQKPTISSTFGFEASDLTLILTRCHPDRLSTAGLRTKLRSPMTVIPTKYPITEIPINHEELHVIKAMHSLSGSSAFSDDQKASLLVYFCDYPGVAAAVPDETSSREAFYQDLLKQLDSE